MYCIFLLLCNSAMLYQITRTQIMNNLLLKSYLVRNGQKKVRFLNQQWGVFTILRG